MASNVVRYAIATARTPPSSCLSNSVNTAIQRVNSTLFSRCHISYNSISFLRALATAAVSKKRVTKRTTTTKKATRQATTRRKPAGKAASPKKRKVAKKPVKKRKVLSVKQKEAAQKRQTAVRVKQLKEQALIPPKLKTVNPYAIFLAQTIERGSSTTPITERAKAVAHKFASISPSEREELNIIAVENKADNERTYDAWLKSHTPEQIRLANHARSLVRRQQKAKKIAHVKLSRFRKLKDSRQVKAPAQSFVFYFTERHAAGVFRNIKITDAMKLARDEFKALSTSEHKKYQDLAEADRQRYAREYQSTYGHPPTVTKPKVRATAAA